jgi:predicted nucleic acid-binding protein
MNRVALDTNVLLRLASPQHPLNALTLSAIEQLRRVDRHVVVFPQVIYEFWAVGTRTIAANGLGLAPSNVGILIDELTDKVPVLHDDRRVYDHWRQLADEYAVTGVNSHDMRIVAAMRTHGITAPLTYNDSDFSRYHGIEVLTPERVVASPPVAGQ